MQGTQNVSLNYRINFIWVPPHSAHSSTETQIAALVFLGSMLQATSSYQERLCPHAHYAAIQIPVK